MQSRKLSLLEAKANAIVGILVSWAFTFWVMPMLFGVQFSAPQATGITVIYFVLSTARAYIIRRIFNLL